MPAKKKVAKKAVEPKENKGENPKVSQRSFRVFYRELNSEGKREGSVANKIFSKEKDAVDFAEQVGGEIR